MAQDNQQNAAQSFSAMVTEWERNFDAFANQVMGTEAYSQAMNEMQKAQLGAQRGFSQMMAQQLAAMNVPSRDDLLKLTELVQQMDLRLQHLEEMLATKGSKGGKKSKAPARKRPARTKVPPNQDKTGSES